jgi:hypothetical protein
MKISDFEEKEYEGPLYNQIEKSTNLLWQPGQVFENAIGVDRCAYIDDISIWKQLGFHSIPVGVCLPRYNWNYIWLKRGKKKTLPSFKLNLFIQAKRCYKGNVPKKLNGYNFGKQCCKFDIVAHQQVALEQVAKNLKNRAILLYAAPMFRSQSELYKHTANSSIIENSTFPEIIKLSGHSTWYYNHKLNGIANLEPKFIDIEGLIKKVNNFHSETYENEEETNSISEIISLRDQIYSSFTEEEFEHDSKTALLFNKRDELRNYLSYYDVFDVYELEAIYSFYEITLFTLVYNLNWFIIGSRS